MVMLTNAKEGEYHRRKKRRKESKKMMVEQDNYMKHNGIRILSQSEEESLLEVELKKEGQNMYQYAHGSLIMALCDCAGGVAAHHDGRNYVTQNANVTFISNIQSGVLRARAKVLHRGKKTTVTQIEVRNEEEKLLAEGTVSMYCLGPKS